MALKQGNKYKCSYCETVYTHEQQADACRDKHDLVYLQISKTDLNKLVNFLYLKNDELLTPSLIKVLTRHLHRG